MIPGETKHGTFSLAGYKPRNSFLFQLDIRSESTCSRKTRNSMLINRTIFQLLLCHTFYPSGPTLFSPKFSPASTNRSAMKSISSVYTLGIYSLAHHLNWPKYWRPVWMMTYLLADSFTIRQSMPVMVQPSPKRWLPSLSLPPKLNAIPSCFYDDTNIFI